MNQYCKENNTDNGRETFSAVCRDASGYRFSVAKIHR
jgi:hypothetical protein